MSPFKSFAGVIQSGTRKDPSVWMKLCCLVPGGDNLHYYVYKQHAITGEGGSSLILIIICELLLNLLENATVGSYHFFLHMFYCFNNVCN